MKTTPLVTLASALLMTVSFAQTPAETAAANASRSPIGASARDGFTMRGSEIVMTRDGITTKVQREVVLPNGMKVQPNGTITMRDGSTANLGLNQMLTFDGTVQNVALNAQGIAPLSSVDAGPTPKADVGLSSHDGITMSGADVFITRNGVMERLTADVRLPNGVVAQSDGTVILSGGNKITLRPNQVLDLSGVLRDAPVRTGVDASQPRTVPNQ